MLVIDDIPLLFESTIRPEAVVLVSEVIRRFGWAPVLRRGDTTNTGILVNDILASVENVILNLPVFGVLIDVTTPHPIFNAD